MKILNQITVVGVMDVELAIGAYGNSIRALRKFVADENNIEHIKLFANLAVDEELFLESPKRYLMEILIAEFFRYLCECKCTPTFLSLNPADKTELVNFASIEFDECISSELFSAVEKFLELFNQM